MQGTNSTSSGVVPDILQREATTDQLSIGRGRGLHLGSPTLLDRTVAFCLEHTVILQGADGGLCCGHTRVLATKVRNACRT